MVELGVMSILSIHESGFHGVINICMLCSHTTATL